jgi:hypothetical protein
LAPAVDVGSPWRAAKFSSSGLAERQGSPSTPPEYADPIHLRFDAPGVSWRFRGADSATRPTLRPKPSSSRAVPPTTTFAHVVATRGVTPRRCPSAGEDLLGTRVSRKAGEARSHRQGWRGSTQISRRRPAGTARAPCAKCYAGCRAPQAGGAQAVLVSAGGVRPREPAAPDSVATSTAASSGRRMAGHSGSARINGGHRGAADGCVPFGVPQRPQTRGQSQGAAES